MTEVATVPLALHDFVPVVLAGLGALWVARSTRRGPALVGAVLVLLGGLCKAGWKLNLALTGDDVALIDDLLFAFLAPGFALLAWSLVRRELPLALPLAISAAALLGAALLEHTAPLLVLTIVGATATSVLAIRRALAADDLAAVGLFALQLTLAFALVPFAGAGQSISNQWWEQSLNTIGQGAFAVGGWRLLQHSEIRSNA